MIGVLLTTLAPADFVNRIGVFSAVILTAITFVYVLITEKILNESTKTRKIDFISKQLEELYYPLLDFLNEYSEVLNMPDWSEVKHDSSTAPRELRYLGDRDDSHDGYVIISDLVRKKYLFKEKDTKVFFTIFVEDEHCSNNISSDISLRTYDELKRLVKEDIYALEVKLRSLTT